MNVFDFFAVLFGMIAGFMPVTIVFYSLMFIAYRIVLAVLARQNAIARNLDNDKTWGVLCGVLGIIPFFVFALVNRKVGISPDAILKRKHKKAMAVFCAIMILCIVYSPFIALEFKYYDRRQEKDEFGSHPCYLTEDGWHWETFDKMGNSYSAYNYNYDILYYTKDGGVYKEYFGETLEDDGYIDEKTNVIIKDGNAFIDENGYLVSKNKDSLKPIARGDGADRILYYTDEKENMYFDVYDCGWDKDGKLVLSSSEVNDILSEKTKGV